MTLAERENRRKSVVGAIAGVQPEYPRKKEKPRGYVIAPAKIETRSKRLNLLIPPSVYEKACLKCRDNDISLNECVNQLLLHWVEH